MEIKEIEKIQIPRTVPIDIFLDDTMSIYQKFLRNAVEKFDEIVESVFKEYGYSKDEIFELYKLGCVEGERCMSTIEPGVSWITYSVHGETLFTIMEKIDLGNYKISYHIERLKGDKDGSADY